MLAATVHGDEAEARHSDQDYQQLATCLAALDSRLNEINHVILRLQRRTTADGKVAPDDAALTAELAATRTANEEKRRRLQQPAKDVARPPDDSADPAQQLADIESKCNEIVQRIATLKAAKDTGTGLGFNAGKRVIGKEVVELAIIKGRVVPLCAPYYSATGLRAGATVVAVQIERKMDGIEVDTAIRDGGLLDQILKEKGASPESHVFKLLVCADSVGSFHQVRQAILKKRYSYGWDTWLDRTILVNANGGGGDGGVEISQ